MPTRSLSRDRIHGKCPYNQIISLRPVSTSVLLDKLLSGAQTWRNPTRSEGFCLCTDIWQSDNVCICLSCEVVMKTMWNSRSFKNACLLDKLRQQEYSYCSQWHLRMHMADGGMRVLSALQECSRKWFTAVTKRSHSWLLLAKRGSERREEINCPASLLRIILVSPSITCSISWSLLGIALKKPTSSVWYLHMSYKV